MKLRDLISTKVAELEGKGTRLRREAAEYLAQLDADIAKWRSLPGSLEAHLDREAKPADTPEAVAKQFAK